MRRPAADDAPAANMDLPLASQASVAARGNALLRRVGNSPVAARLAPALLIHARRSWVICRSNAPCGRSPPPAFQPAEGEKGSDQFSQEHAGFSRGGGRENGSDPSFPGSASVAASDVAAQWQRSVAEGQATLSYAVPGPNDAVALEYRPIEPSAWLPRLAGIAGFLIIVGLAGLIVRLGLLRSLIVRWPAVFGVGFGLAWWLWLSPSAVGLLIVLVVLLCRFLPRKLLGRPAAVGG